jgi:hypothetical protein
MNSIYLRVSYAALCSIYRILWEQSDVWNMTCGHILYMRRNYFYTLMRNKRFTIAWYDGDKGMWLMPLSHFPHATDYNHGYTIVLRYK